MIGYGYYIILYIILIVLHYMFYINAKPDMKRNSRSRAPSSNYVTSNHLPVNNL